MNVIDNAEIDPRLNKIDDCLYRVAARIFVMQDDKVLLVKESEDEWWALPGGGIDHGESIESALKREIEEELGVPASEISSDFQIVHYTIGSVVNGVPRMNLFFKVSLREDSLKSTSHVADWGWFTKDNFLSADLHSSYSKEKLAAVIFSD
jgi:8-oxo-dGTP pyrophosphatase MutT (NUDIX family)